MVNDDGTCRFRASPGGRQRYLTVDAEQIARVREALALLCSQPPKGDYSSFSTHNNLTKSSTVIPAARMRDRNVPGAISR